MPSHDFPAHEHSRVPLRPESDYGEVHDHGGRLQDRTVAHAAHARVVDHTRPSERAAAGLDQAMFFRRFWLCLVLTIPVLLYSPALQTLLHFNMLAFQGSQWIAPGFAAAVFVFGGVPFLQRAVPELRRRQPGSMTLIALALILLFGYRLAAFIAGASGDFFWEWSALVDILLLGRWLELRIVAQAMGALGGLAALMPDTAERVSGDDAIETIRVRQLKPGYLILVRPGDSIAADGQVVEGESEVDESMLTGRAAAVKKGPGSSVLAGTINGGGALRVKVTGAGGATVLAQMMQAVEDARQTKSRAQARADRAAGWLFFLALAAALLAGVGWMLARGWNADIMSRVAAVLLVAAPSAFALAVPPAVAIATSLGARSGILIRGRSALQAAQQVDLLLFEMTGTLTRGQPDVVGRAAAAGWDEVQALALAAAIEGQSAHGIGRALRAAAEAEHLELPEATGFEALPGRGVRAIVAGHNAQVGGPNLVARLNLSVPPELSLFTDEAESKGEAVVYLALDRTLIAAFALADTIRAESQAAVQRLRERGLRAALITAEAEPVAQRVARELGIGRYFAQALPEDKERTVSELQQEGKRVALVGDGVEDAPALARADLGIAMGIGTNLGLEAAGIVLVGSSPLDLDKVFQLSRACHHKVLENLVWATGYNLLALPLAAGVLASFGILLSPAVAALLMSLGALFVPLNALQLRRLPLAPD